MDKDQKASIYIVFGTTGEYSSREAWPVKAFASFEKARGLVVHAESRANQLYDEYTKEDEYGFIDIPDGANEYDPQMWMDSNRTRYWVEECGFDDEEDAE